MLRIDKASKCTYICFLKNTYMSTKLTLTIDEKVIARLRENYLRSLKGAIRVGSKDLEYKEMLEDELLKKYLG